MLARGPVDVPALTDAFTRALGVQNIHVTDLGRAGPRAREFATIVRNARDLSTVARLGLATYRAGRFRQKGTERPG